jgi:hypothetical protein
MCAWQGDYIAAMADTGPVRFEAIAAMAALTRCSGTGQCERTKLQRAERALQILKDS